MKFNAALAATLISTCIARPVHNHAAMHRRGINAVAVTNNSDILGRGVLDTRSPVIGDRPLHSLRQGTTSTPQGNRVKVTDNQAAQDLIAQLSKQKFAGQQENRQMNPNGQKIQPPNRRDGEEGSEPIALLLQLVTGITQMMKRDRVEMSKRGFLDGASGQADESSDPISLLLRLATDLTDIVSRDAVYMTKEATPGW